jgi:hypothetical protein
MLMNYELLATNCEFHCWKFKCCELEEVAHAPAADARGARAVLAGCKEQYLLIKYEAWA